MAVFRFILTLVTVSLLASACNAFAAPEIVQPVAGSTLSGSAQTFSWSLNDVEESEIDKWWLYVGTSVGARDIANSGDLGKDTEYDVIGLPIDGSIVHIRLWYFSSARWSYVDSSYSAATIDAEVTTPAMISPANGSELAGASASFEWRDNNTPVNFWWLYLGSRQGDRDIYDSGRDIRSQTSVTVNQLPVDGSPIYARLWFRTAADGWQYADTEYFTFDDVDDRPDPDSPDAASRFLAQATFGPTPASVQQLLNSSYADWIATQQALPLNTMLQAFDEQQALNPDSAPSRDWITESFWRRSVIADDQLRQRVAFALSQIFVISLRDGGVASAPRGAADFYSRLEQHAFGNFRQLLEEVTLHPMMGLYLSHLGNEKGDPATGRQPDENFARELMQLFTIGLYELNPDGTRRLSEDGTPIETYSNTDVQGLARVFTGFSWNGPDKQLGRFQGWIPAPNRAIMLMQDYPEFHSVLEKSFLGTVIPASDVSSPNEDLSIALDTLFNHPNVGPFISRQLIQRMVTSNPSAAYVQRVSDVFADNGSGIRGDMAALIRAILTDYESRDMSLVTDASQGRIREPILRLSHWMRSFGAYSVSSRFSILGTDDPATSLGMTVLRSPSVFNFYRPQHVPPNTAIASAGLVSPEMQITHETSVAGYLNDMLNTMELGGGSSFDIQSDYVEASAVAHNSTELVDHVDLLVTHGSMSDELKSLIIEAVELVPMPDEDDQAARVQRSQIAAYLAMSSPEYLVLK